MGSKEEESSFIERLIENFPTTEPMPPINKTT